MYRICYLAHPFLRGYHDPLEEPTVAPVIDEHQDAEYRISKWKCKSFETETSLQGFLLIGNHDFLFR
jgi:hypothetical protein